MNKNIVIVILIVVLLVSNAAWLNMLKSNLSDFSRHSELEIEVRDKVIGEMSELLIFQNRDISKAKLIELLSTEFDSPQIKDEGQWVYFRTLKFEFRDNSLLKVYW